ncbi:cadmium-translocating P-type ATPase [bacterium]|nr:cadmium-translocating P-type ATPase [bacterium]
MKKIKINEDLIRIIISIVLLVLGMIFNENIYLLVISYVFVSKEVYFNAFKNIKNGEIFDENFLMIIATLGAFYIGEYPEAVLVMLLFSIGEYLSDLAVDNSKKAIVELMDLRSDKINLKDIGVTDVNNANVGDIFVVAPGEKVALDGIIIKGESHLDTSSLTGETMPRAVYKNSEVLSGTINLEGVLEVKATKTFETSTASKIIEILEKSEEKKTKTEKFITRFSKVYTPIVVLLAILIIIIPTILGGNFNTWLYRALEMLVISCPCALVISVPLGYFSGIGKCSKEGILVKGSNILDDLVNIDTIIFDKTGTITEGVFEVTKIYSVNNKDTELLKLAAEAEANSNHPIALSIKKAYGKEIKSKITNAKEISGAGISCIIGKDNILVGNKKLLKYNKIDVEVNKELGTIVYVAKNKKLLGYIVISDKIKTNAKESLDKLRNDGINNLIMLSGDAEEVVNIISKKLNLDKAYGNLLPQDKVNILEEYKMKNKTAFVGDGINDAPVIKLADVGIAMGGIGSDATIEASDIVLMKDDLSNLADAIKISKITKKIVLSNIIFAIMFKIIMLILAILGITPIWLAVFADVGVTIISVLNSLRIFIKKL